MRGAANARCTFSPPESLNPTILSRADTNQCFVIVSLGQIEDVPRRCGTQALTAAT